jgi:hypothetical protein
MILRLTLEAFNQSGKAEKKTYVGSIDDKYIETLANKEELVLNMLKSLEKDIEEMVPTIMRNFFPMRL